MSIAAAVHSALALSFDAAADGEAGAGTDERPQAEAGSASEDRWMYAGARVLLGRRARIRPMDGSIIPSPFGSRGLAAAARTTRAGTGSARNAWHRSPWALFDPRVRVRLD